MGEYTMAKTYFGILGIVTVLFGVAELAVTAGGTSFSWSILEIPNEMFRGGWGGFVVLFAGFFYLSSLKNFSEVHQFSKAVMGSIMIWVMAGLDIFAMITESIPSEEG
ncbi:MAG: hypothetical protein KAX04_06215, partial [Methanomicrobia archaeon]|nr:hypothetical protein [Methanomicrobia archaeon]